MSNSLKERKPEELLKHLCDLMEEPDEEKAATTLQKHFENVVGNDKSLQKMACFGKYIMRKVNSLLKRQYKTTIFNLQ